MNKSRKRRGVDRNGNILPVALVIGGGAVLLLLGALAVIGGPGRKVPIEVRGQPKLQVDTEVVDLGDVKLGKTVEAAFVLANVGDQPLSLTATPYVEVVEGC